MSLLSNEIKARLKIISNLEKQLNIRLKNTPEGRLRTSTVNGKTRYYQMKKTEKEKSHYISHSQMDMAKRLAQKDYDTKILQMLKKEERRLRNINNYYNAYNCNSITEKTGSKTSKTSKSLTGNDFFSGPEELVWARMTEARKALIEPIEYDNASYIAAWKSEEYEAKGFKEDDYEYFTGNGIRVRSKTELIIADMLDRKEIPYYYEKPLHLKGLGIIHPDFTVLNVKHRKTLYWEHMGMMDNENYAEHALERITFYMMNGYFPGRDLILTHESSARPIRSQILESVIDTYILN